MRKVTLDGRAIPLRWEQDMRAGVGCPDRPAGPPQASLAVATIQGAHELSHGPCKGAESEGGGRRSPLPCSAVFTAFRILRVCPPAPPLVAPLARGPARRSRRFASSPQTPRPHIVRSCAAAACTAAPAPPADQQPAEPAAASVLRLPGPPARPAEPSSLARLILRAFFFVPAGKP